MLASQKLHILCTRETFEIYVEDRYVIFKNLLLKANTKDILSLNKKLCDSTEKSLATP